MGVWGPRRSASRIPSQAGLQAGPYCTRVGRARKQEKPLQREDFGRLVARWSTRSARANRLAERVGHAPPLIRLAGENGALAGQEADADVEGHDEGEEDEGSAPGLALENWIAAE